MKHKDFFDIHRPPPPGISGGVYLDDILKTAEQSANEFINSGIKFIALTYRNDKLTVWYEENKIEEV